MADIAARRLALLDRAWRWVTEQVGRFARTVNEVAVKLGCDGHTINDTVVAYDTALIEDPGRFGVVEAARTRRGPLRSDWQVWHR